MLKKLVIELSAQATEKYLNLAAKKTAAEIADDCEPSGTTILVDISAYGVRAYIQDKGRVDLGDAEIQWVDIE